MGGNGAREEAGAQHPHDHTTYLSLAASTSMLFMLVAVVERAGRCCGVWAGKGAEGESLLRMMMMRTTDGQPWFAGQSKANKSKQLRGKAAQWGRHKSRVHTRLAGHTKEGGREFKNQAFHRHGARPRDFKEATPRGVLEWGSSMRPSTEKAIRMNARNRRILRLQFVRSSGKFGPRSGEQWSSLVDDSARGDSGHGDPCGDPR